MNYFDLYSSYSDRTIAAAWDSQVKEADQTPWLADALTGCGDELFARFAACYADLRALPRSARRALQRQLARSSELAAILPEYLQHGGRRLQHRMAWSVAGAALLLALGQGVATAATITVTTNDPRIVADGQCSLVEAIVNANNDAATYPDCPAGSGADTIVLPANAYMMLSNPYVPRYTTPLGTFSDTPAGLPVITTQITIEGNGATITRDGNAPAFGLMRVRGNFPPPAMPGNLTIEGLTLSGGSSFGGLSNDGTLSIKNSTISGNTGRGVNNNGALTIENSTISANTGGGVNNYYGTLTIHNSTVSGNTSNFAGGGLNNSAGTVTITNSTISDNTGGVGGGVSNSLGYYYGGTGSVTLTNSTISGNRADRGGGVYNAGRCFSNPFIGQTCNFATLTLNRSLIAGNQATVGAEIENLGTANANNFNLFGSNGNAGVSGFSPGRRDIVPGVGVAQILGPLKNNGGPTQSHGLVAASPAIDAGDPGGCRDSSGALLQTDQRGFARHADGNSDGTARCDIGAVEGLGFAAPVDFDGDGKSDLTIYRDGVWFVLRSSNEGGIGITWGGALQDVPVPGDYDGDGKTDQAVYRDGVWWILRSSDGGGMAITWGGAPKDLPVPGDYDGDGKTDQAVYRDGVWYILRSSDGGGMAITWGGAPQDIPLNGAPHDIPLK